MCDAGNQPVFGVDFGLEAADLDGGFRVEVWAAGGEVDFKFGGAALDALKGGAGAVFGGGLAGIEMAQGFDFEAVGGYDFGDADGFGGDFVGFAVFALGFVFAGGGLSGFDGDEVVFIDDDLFFLAAFFVDVSGAHGVISLGVAVGKAVSVAAHAGEQYGRHGLAAGGDGLAFGHKQQDAVFNRGNGVVEVGEAG